VLLILAVLVIMPRSGPETYRVLTTSESNEELPTLTKVSYWHCCCRHGIHMYPTQRRVSASPCLSMPSVQGGRMGPETLLSRGT